MSSKILTVVPLEVGGEVVVGGLRRIFTAKLFIFVLYTFVISGEKKRKEYNLTKYTSSPNN